MLPIDPQIALSAISHPHNVKESHVVDRKFVRKREFKQMQPGRPSHR